MKKNLLLLLKKEKAYEFKKNFQKRGGASPLNSQRAAGPDTQIVSENTPEVGEEESKCYADICHPEAKPKDLLRFFAGAQDDVKLFPRPLWERKEFLNERSEFRNSGEGSNELNNRKPLIRICSSLCSHNCVLSHKGRGKDTDRKAAFTLAEVLITLGIIGVVAAMTIPTLISNYQRKVLAAQFKKSYAVASQIVLRSKFELGTGTFGQYCTNYTSGKYLNKDICLQTIYKVMFPKKSSTNYNNVDLVRSDISSFNNKQTGLSSDDLGGMGYPVLYTNIMPDGTYMNVNINEFYINFGIDINGAKGPNKLGWDVFLFRVDNKNDSLAGIKQTREYTDEELEEIDFSENPINKNRYGYPCNLNTSMRGNGLGCSWYALNNICPWDETKTYWECLP